MADQCGQRGVGAAALVAEVFGASRVAVALVAVVVTVSGSSKVMTAATSAATGAKG